jgi:prepilin-type N-terminal cleavage/methylation domain-containing protein
MLKQLKKREQGFTIIEVLIVLAIAGLILLIVFLAVPALQRNSRNTQRRDDVAKLLSLVTEYSSNNNGQLPTGASCSGSVMQLTGTSTATTKADGVIYCRTSGTSIAWSTTATSPNNSTDVVTLRSNVVCDGSTGNATTSGASARNFVALYRLEPDVPQCQQS